ncbi:hypothetical protein Y1Q_0009857 [Alligator mississippiensis]|uniref:Uncharacterized protein n=1 Tax=Alligator mississippiensis TaxID=8496 RepID=A0A151MX70_ALLMI|nr:hypothetical protein Y1Q_0009857 [Alligator mississippiensis]
MKSSRGFLTHIHLFGLRYEGQYTRENKVDLRCYVWLALGVWLELAQDGACAFASEDNSRNRETEEFWHGKWDVAYQPLTVASTQTQTERRKNSYSS